MNVACKTIIYDKSEAEDFCESVKKLGITPVVSDNIISAEYTGNKVIGTELVELFKQCDVHETFMFD